MAYHLYESGLPSRMQGGVRFAWPAILDRLNDADDGACLACWTPAVDIEEREGSFTVRVDLPGVASGEIKATLEFGRLTLSGLRKTRRTEPGAGYNPKAWAREWFFRQLTLPGSDEGDRVQARFHDEVLEMIIPKLQQPGARQITITE